MAINKKFILKDINEVYDALKSVANSKKHDLDIQYAMDDILDVLQKNYDRYGKEKTSLAKDLGDEDPRRYGLYRVKPENMEEFTKELEKIGSVEVNITFEPLNTDDLLDHNVEMDNNEFRPLKRCGIIVRSEKKSRNMKTNNE